MLYAVKVEMDALWHRAPVSIWSQFIFIGNKPFVLHKIVGYLGKWMSLWTNAAISCACFWTLHGIWLYVLSGRSYEWEIAHYKYERAAVLSGRFIGRFWLYGSWIVQALLATNKSDHTTRVESDTHEFDSTKSSDPNRRLDFKVFKTNVLENGFWPSEKHRHIRKPSIKAKQSINTNRTKLRI